MYKMSEIKKIAITGTIGSGKTEACNYLKTKGYKVLSCDEINSTLLRNGNKGYDEVSKVFKESVVDKQIDKKILADIVFKDADKLNTLNSIMHPLILEEILNNKSVPLIVEVPLLFECAWDKYFDCNLLLVCDDKLALNRLLDRGIDQVEASRRIKYQMSVEEKIKRADKIIYNNGSLQDMYIELDKFIKDILC